MAVAPPPDPLGVSILPGAARQFWPPQSRPLWLICFVQMPDSGRGKETGMKRQVAAVECLDQLRKVYEGWLRGELAGEDVLFTLGEIVRPPDPPASSVSRTEARETRNAAP